MPTAPSESLDFLSPLWDADPLGQARVMLVMATEELALAQWPAAWLDRVDLRVELDLWWLDDVRQFLARIVGEEQQRGRGFEPAAIERLHQIAGGLPRQLRTPGPTLLVGHGRAAGRATVDEATVTGVSHELCRPAPAYHHAGPAIEFVRASPANDCRTELRPQK